MKSSLLKTTARISLMVFFISLVALCLSAKIATAEDLMCWSFVVTEDEHGPLPTPETSTSKFRVTPTGNQTYTLQGIITDPDPGTYIADGTGIVFADKIVVTMNGSHDEHGEGNAWRDSGTIHMTLDRSTFNGTFWYISLDFNTSTREFDHSYSAGTVTRITCP